MGTGRNNEGEVTDKDLVTVLPDWKAGPNPYVQSSSSMTNLTWTRTIGKGKPYDSSVTHYEVRYDFMTDGFRIYKAVEEPTRPYRYVSMSAPEKPCLAWQLVRNCPVFPTPLGAMVWFEVEGG